MLKQLLILVPLLSTAAQAFESPFLFGVASSAFQVEGSPVDSNWREWTQQPGRIADQSNAERSADFWNRYQEDINLAKELGAKAFRISIAWERIQPTNYKSWDEKALNHYQKIIESIRAANMEPIVTLHHWVLPAWLELGLLNPGFEIYFTNFAEKVVDRFSTGPAAVRYWMTFNEPMVQTLVGYVGGQFPPGIDGVPKARRFSRMNRARAHMIKAHVATYKKLKSKAYGNNILISVAAHIRDFQPKNPQKWQDRFMTHIGHEIFNQEFLDALSFGKMELKNPDVVSPLNPFGVEIRERLDFGGFKSTLDYLGINYYGRFMIEALNTWGLPLNVKQHEGPGQWRSDAVFHADDKSKMSWELYPEGLSKVLGWAHQRYQLPIIISENGLADARDLSRSKFIHEHIKEVKEARAAGVQVFGYLYWSLTDNFEWIEGLTPRFGLVEINYDTLERKPRPSFYEYQRLIRDSGL